MSTHYRRHDDPPQQWPDPPPETVRAHHYVRQEASGRTTLVLYDVENPLAWIKSSAWVTLEDVL